MARKDDLKMLFNFLIDLLKDEEAKDSNDSDKKLISEEVKKDNNNIGVIDASRIKDIMDKMQTKDHNDAIIKKALKIQERSYKKEIEDLKEAFNKKTLVEDKLETPKENTNFSGGTVYSEFISKIKL